MKVLDYGLITVAEELQQIAFSADLNSSDSPDNGQQLSPSEDVCIEAVDKHVKEVLNSIDKNKARRESIAKNVTNCRHRISKEFMHTHMVNKRRYCPGCKAPSREVRSEYNNSVFLKALSVREANKWVNTQVVQAHLAAKHSVPVTNGTNENTDHRGKTNTLLTKVSSDIMTLFLFVSTLYWIFFPLPITKDRSYLIDLNSGEFVNGLQ